MHWYCYQNYLYASMILIEGMCLKRLKVLPKPIHFHNKENRIKDIWQPMCHLNYCGLLFIAHTLSISKKAYYQVRKAVCVHLWEVRGRCQWSMQLHCEPSKEKQLYFLQKGKMGTIMIYKIFILLKHLQYKSLLSGELEREHVQSPSMDCAY